MLLYDIEVLRFYGEWISTSSGERLVAVELLYVQTVSREAVGHDRDAHVVECVPEGARHGRAHCVEQLHEDFVLGPEEVLHDVRDVQESLSFLPREDDGVLGNRRLGLGRHGSRMFYDGRSKFAGADELDCRIKVFCKDERVLRYAEPRLECAVDGFGN